MSGSVYYPIFDPVIFDPKIFGGGSVSKSATSVTRTAGPYIAPPPPVMPFDMDTMKLIQLYLEYKMEKTTDATIPSS